MGIKAGRFGRFVACTGYPSARTTHPLKDTENGANSPAADVATDEVCDQCGKPMVIKTGRFGKFMACTGYPECKATRPMKTGAICPKCGGDLVERRARDGAVPSTAAPSTRTATSSSTSVRWAAPAPNAAAWWFTPARTWRPVLSALGTALRRRWTGVCLPIIMPTPPTPKRARTSGGGRLTQRSEVEQQRFHGGLCCSGESRCRGKGSRLFDGIAGRLGSISTKSAGPGPGQ